MDGKQGALLLGELGEFYSAISVYVFPTRFTKISRTVFYSGTYAFSTKFSRTLMNFFFADSLLREGVSVQP